MTKEEGIIEVSESYSGANFLLYLEFLFQDDENSP